MRPGGLELPVRAVLPALAAALDEGGSAVLSAPPGTGKTTLVPLALAGLLDGPPAAPRTVLVAEPRRLAVRAAARRMAWLLDEPVGRTVGFTVRGERRAGPGTRVEVVTTGVLLQRLQRDPELPGVDAVVLDECHERHLDADTALAFLLDVRAALRPELRLLLASATADTAAWAELLDGAPVVAAEGVSHPVETVWAPPPTAVRPAHGTRVDPALLAHVAATVRRALAERDGDVLCFLPGVGEIARVAGQLGADGVEVLQLHGQAPQAVQDAALAAGERRRVVLATSVAESSLTVPGVRVVVDSGLTREPRTDHARGLSALVTVRTSLAAARQRAGRAGREAPGTVYRCWAEAEDARAARFPTPEIALADLTSFALQAACWGAPDATGLTLPDAPPPGALAAARDVLRALAAIGPDGRPTPRGRAIARTGLHPRLARALLDGAPAVGARRAAELVALLSEEPPRALGDDLAEIHRTVRRSPADPYARRWKDETRRLERALEDTASGPGSGPVGPSDAVAAGLVVGLAYPERVARAREGGEGAERGERGEGAYLMASGTAARLGSGSRLPAGGWLAVAVADRPAGAPSARVLRAVAIDEATARRAAAPLLTAREEVHWSVRQREAVARRVEALGAVELAAAPLPSPDPALLRAALLEGLEREGVSALLSWPPAAGGLRERLAFLHRAVGDPWPDVSDGGLLAAAGQWLEPELSRARRRADLERIDTATALRRLLPWASGQAGRLDELAPERITVPSGSRVRVDYATDPDRPVLAVKLQELFGWSAAPALAGGRVPLTVHLLSPAGRPAAVTGDLAGFWREGYRAVRADLRGRYPRHPWPEDPTTAEPTRRANPRR
ncbi:MULTISPECIES: ATP-dependent helicase HrpB [Kitasatospora]|uniref:Putative ATP-dependent RNA helicase n=1 Tax=Kitasatospora setae (strain ATCC 33774 / DSM 43861 / JCM 3304 / KCC A-0304 / NBRC 14216 / KM-6054) TaxID=452652 RepID=E4N9G5_KITSK|nr:ATP-dependent helicase HrpB [Kitasatospora setae]BAJ27846.1 putative ATP-dependent RNA helicase [Kitasatospora setae KM-6054]